MLSASLAWGNQFSTHSPPSARGLAQQFPSTEYRGGGGAGLPLIREWKLQRTLPSLVGQYKLPRKRLSLFCFSLKEDLSQTGTSPYSGVRVGGGWAGGVSDRSGGKS